MNQVVDFINVNRDRYIEELKQYLAIPSISALPDQAAQEEVACYEWAASAVDYFDEDDDYEYDEEDFEDYEDDEDETYG